MTDTVFSEQESSASLSYRAVKALSSLGLTVFTAESCTGGLVAKLLTDIAGASAVVRGGIVSYTNEIKISLLGVSPETIKKYTEVSLECAAEMAEGARKISGADITVSATGYASGGEGVPDGMAGIIYISLSDKNGTITKTLRLNGDRQENRERAANEILKMILSLYERKNRYE